MKKKFEFKNLETLQLVRAVAVILVVFHHSYHLLIKYYGIDAPYFSLFEYGSMGVDLFFVLSGFIIFYIHHKDIGNKKRLNAFILKRFVRIYPIYWVITLSFVFINLMEGNLYSTIYFLKSFFLLPQSNQPIIGVAWSLIHEILFYIIFSLLIYSRRIVYPLIGTWVVLIIILLAWPTHTFENEFVNLILNPLNLEFLFGCLIAFIALNFNKNFRWMINVGLCGIVFFVLIQHIGNMEINRIVSWGIPSSFLILGLVNWEFRKEISVPKLLLYLGDASYSIYLTHIITLIFFDSIIKHFDIYSKIEHHVTIAIIAGIIAVLLGCVFYNIVEKPLLNYLKKKIIKSKNKSSENLEQKVQLID